MGEGQRVGGVSFGEDLNFQTNHSDFGGIFGGLRYHRRLGVDAF